MSSVQILLSLPRWQSTLSLFLSLSSCQKYKNCHYKMDVASNVVSVDADKVILGNEYQYDPKDQIGQGSYAKVVKGHQIMTGRIVAIKICSRLKMDEEETISLQKQVHIMKQIHHPNIVDFFAVYMDKKHIYLVLEYLEGGELYEHILQKQSFSENQAKQTLMPIIDAVRYLHSSGIVHRDLKPENIVYTEKQGVKVLKIIDFGVSQIISNETVMSTAIGTPLYMAPQILTGNKYRGAVDIWSIGVILYILLCGYPPFQSDNENQLQNEIRSAQIGFDPDDWSEISQQAIDLIKRMLDRDPDHRIKMNQIDDHPWIKEQVSKKNLANTKMRFHKAVKKLKTALKVFRYLKK